LHLIAQEAIMAIDEQTRQELYRRLEEVLGRGAAVALMEYLPPVGWADVATKHDLAGLEQRMDLRFARVDEHFARVDEQFARVDEQFAGLEQRMDLRLTSSASDLRAAFEHGLRAQTTTMVFALVSIVLTMAGFVHFA
jgi:hypothetical protein